MQIWDSGWYELLRETDFDAALASGELKLMVRGRRLRGEWHMVRTSRDDANAQEEWLLFKARDGYARDADELVPAIDTDLARAAPPPKRPRPMHAGDEVAVFSHHDWVFELELPGVRALLVKAGDRVREIVDGEQALHPAALELLATDVAAVRAEHAVQLQLVGGVEAGHEVGQRVLVSKEPKVIAVDDEPGVLSPVPEHARRSSRLPETQPQRQFTTG